MSELTFYRGWLLLPLGLPVAAGLLAPLLPEAARSGTGTVLILLYMAALFGAPIYVPLACGLWAWLPGQPAARVRVASGLAPFPIVAFAAAVPFLRDWWPVALAVCYGWVAAFIVSERAARWVGALRAGPVPAERGVAAVGSAGRRQRGR